MNTIILKDDLFKIELFLIYDCSFGEFADHLERRHNVSVKDRDDDLTDGSTICFRSKVFMWFDGEVDHADPEFVSLLMHEVGHGVFHVLSRADVPVRVGENEEMFLYLQSYYVEEFLKKIRKSLKQPRKRQ